MGLTHFLVLVILASTTSITKSADDTPIPEKSNVDFYLNVVQPVTAASFDNLAKLKLSTFHFDFDSLKGRLQLGALGADANKVFPDSVSIEDEKTFRRSSGATVQLKNFHVVDTSVLFMHTIAATKVRGRALCGFHINELKLG